MLILFIFITAIFMGMLPGFFKLDKTFNLTNIITGFAGALTGALLGFGDAPIWLKYNFLNEITLMISVSAIFVFAKVLIARSLKKP